MSTTTVRLPEELKERVAAAAQSRGQTPHAFIVQAIEAQTSEAEAQAEFEHVAQRRWRQYRRDGAAIPLGEAQRYFEQRAAGHDAPRPKARRLGPAQR